MIRVDNMPLQVKGSFLLTPQDARTLLANQAKNRKLTQHRVEEYTYLMETGRWQSASDGSVLFVNKNGELINGQHRLTALVKADVSLPFMIIQADTSSSSMEAIFDQGQNRTVAQITETSRNFCSVCEFLYRWVLKNNMRANPEIVHSFTVKLKAHGLYDSIFSMAQKGMSKHSGNAPVWCRAAFITAKLLKYPGIDSVFDSFISEDVKDNFSNTLWKFIRRTGRPSTMPAKIDAYYQFLSLLKKPTSEKARKSQAIISSVESGLREVLA